MQSRRKPYTRKEAAEFFGKSLKTIDRWISMGLLKVVRRDRSVFIDPASVEIFAQGGPEGGHEGGATASP